MRGKRLPPEIKRVRSSFMLDPRLWSWMEETRRKEGRNRSQFIEAALAAYRAQKEA